MKKYTYIFGIVTLICMSLGVLLHPQTPKQSFLAPQSAPQTHLSQERIIEEILLSKGGFSKEEIAFIHALAELSQNHLQDRLSREELEQEIENISNRFESVLFIPDGEQAYREYLNVSLYGFIEQEYQKHQAHPDSDRLKSLLLGILSDMGKSLPLYNRQALDHEGKVKRETHTGRLDFMDYLMIGSLKKNRKAKERILFYDVAASYGDTTVSSYKRLMRHFPQLKKNCLLIDINMVQYVLYDLHKKRRIFFNALGQPVTQVAEDRSRNIFGYEYNRPNMPGLERYVTIYKELKRQIGANRFFEQDGLVLEQIAMLDPRIKANPDFKAEQYDITRKLSEELPQADVIRIANLLPYFKANSDLQSKIIANLLSKVKPGGIIILNLDDFTRRNPESKIEYVFVLEKSGDLITIRPYLRPEYGEKKAWDLMFHHQIEKLFRIIEDLPYSVRIEPVSSGAPVEFIISQSA